MSDLEEYQLPIDTYSYFTPWAANGYDVILFEEFLLKAFPTLLAFAFLSSPVDPVMPDHLVLPVIPNANITEGWFAFEVDL